MAQEFIVWAKPDEPPQYLRLEGPVDGFGQMILFIFEHNRPRTRPAPKC